MKVTIEFDTSDLADAAALAGFMAGEGAKTAKPKETAAAKPKGETAAQKKKRLAAEKKAAEEKAAAEKAAEADDLMDDGNAGEVTLDDLKGVVKATIERTSIDAVKDVFKAHKAAKLSDLASEDYRTVKDELEAL